jgi:hypothetical protein
VVTPAVAASVRAELLAAPGNEYAARILERLERDNPELASFVAIFAQTQQNPVGIATAAVLTYRLLESQLEADGMARTFGV